MALPLLTAVTLMNDALAVAIAVAPLIEKGDSLTEDDLRRALAGKDAALARLDQLLGS
jgi:hypothetical protein